MGIQPDLFLQDIFGRTSDGVHTEGLVDAADSSELWFHWKARQLNFRGRVEQAWNWMPQIYEDEIVSDLLRPMREAAGLGSPLLCIILMLVNALIV